MYKEFPVTGSKMIELQRGMNFLCELSSVLVSVQNFWDIRIYKNFAKGDTEKSWTRCAQTAAFSVSTQKPVQPGTFTKFFRRERTRETFAKILPGFYIILALTVLYFGVVADATGASDQISARSASQVGYPWQYKIEDIGNTQEGEKLDINISDIETSARGLRNTWVYTGCVMKKKHIVWAGRWVMCFFFMFLADRM